MHCGNHENVPLRPPGVKSIMDCWPQLLPLWIQHCICCQALLPMACSQAVTKHTAGLKLAYQARCRVPLKDDFGLRTLCGPDQIFPETIPESETFDSTLLPSFSHFTGIRPALWNEASSAFCSVPNKYFVHLILCWQSFLSRPRQCISQLDLTLFTDRGRQFCNSGEKI